MENSKQSEHRTGYIFLLIFVLLAAGIVTGAYFAYKNYEKNYRAEIENELSAIADLKVGQIEGWRKERLEDGQVFYKNDVFSAIVKRYTQNRNDREAKTGILTWVGQVQKAYNYDLMMLLDAQFNTILVFPENKELAHLVIDQKNTEILQSGNIAFQDFYRNKQDQHIYLKVLVPILEGRSTKRLIAVLALRISPEEYLYPLIKNWPTASRTAETLIIRKDGESVLFLNDLKFHKDAALNLRIPLESKDVPAVRAALGQEGIFEGTDYRGVPVIADVRAVPDSPWYLVARMDMYEVYEPLKERLWLMIILVSALLTGAGASVGLVWRHQRSRFYQEENKSAEALRASSERLHLALESTNSGAWEWNLITNENIWSDELWKLYGLEPHSCVPSYESWRQTIHPDDREHTEKKVQEAARKGSELNTEWRVISSDGTVRWLMSRGRPLQDANGKIVRFIGIVLDITERKQAEEIFQKAAEEREKLIQELQSALENVKTLQGLIPICANCKKIRDDDGFWQQVEGYIQKHSDIKFTHGICPDCMAKLYPNFVNSQSNEQKKN